MKIDFFGHSSDSSTSTNNHPITFKTADDHVQWLRHNRLKLCENELVFEQFFEGILKDGELRALKGILGDQSS